MNTNANDGVSLFKFPKDADLSKAWNHAVRKTRADWTQHTPHSHLCSEHFERSCFEEGPLLRVAMGIATKCPLVLKKGAVPTVFKKPGNPGSLPDTSSVKSFKTRTAYEKRDRKRVSELCSLLVVLKYKSPLCKYWLTLFKYCPI